MPGPALDMAAMFAATLVVVTLAALSGSAIAGVVGWLDVPPSRRAMRWGAAFVCALAVMPALLSVVGRLAGMDAALAIQLAVAVAGVPAARRSGWPPWPVAAGLVACTACVAVELMDMPWGSQLLQPTFALDMVKHAATVNSIQSWGLPLVDPFVSRDQGAGYYYFFYVLAAMPVRLTGGIVGARASIGALVVLDAAALMGLAALLWRGCVPETSGGTPPTRRMAGVLLATLLCGNLSIVPAALVGIAARRWPIQLEAWNEQVLPWVPSLLWVPHHVSAAIAGVSACLLVAARPSVAAAVIGGLAFASCFGASVWVALGTALGASLWLASLVIRRQGRRALTLAAAGAVAVMLLIPQLYDIVQGRSDGGFPVALTIRAFTVVDAMADPGPARAALRLVLLPLNYALEFGLLAFGAILFWRRRPRPMPEPGHMLAWLAAAGLLLGTFTHSTIINNDLGWRVMLLPQLAGVVWTAAALGQAGRAPGWCRPAMTGTLLAVGLAGTAYGLVAARAYPFLLPDVFFLNFSMRTLGPDKELASAYAWADAHVPRQAILQHNPVARHRIFDFGLYGRNRVAVADAEATLFGASAADVAARLAALGPVFTTSMPSSEVQARAEAWRIDVLVVSSADPVWSDPGSWVWSVAPLFSSSHVRLVAVRALGVVDRPTRSEHEGVKE